MANTFEFTDAQLARKVVDDFLAAEKTLVGAGEWRSYDSDERMRWPVAIDGVPLDMFVEVTVHSVSGGVRPFTITLNWPPCIWRLDFVPYFERHINPFKRGDVTPRTIKGPHFHSWADNSNAAKPKKLPADLDWAKPLSDRISSFEQAFRWFCGETKIILANDQVHDLPPGGLI